VTATAGHHVDHDDDVVLGEICARAASSSGDVAAIVDFEVRQAFPLHSRDAQQRLAQHAVARLVGLGDLDVLLRDPTVDEVLVNAGREIWVDRAGTITSAGHLRGQRVEHLLERILAPIGRRIDRTAPIVDARLADGSRVCAVLPPVAVDGAVLSIRRFPTEVRAIDEFTDADGETLLREILAARCNVVVSGATSSGKTSLLSALLSTTAADERVLVIEDTCELAFGRGRAVRFEARPVLADGPPPVTLADLVKAALRLRPDRIVVGEVRGDEVLALVQAMNTGHDGSMSTCHANGPLDALHRLETLVLQAAPTWPLAAIRQQLQRSIDIVVHVQRDALTRRRSIAEISEVVVASESDPEGRPSVRPLATTTPRGRLDVVAALTRRRVR
jgi:pilus assembly protein CpaF